MLMVAFYLPPRELFVLEMVSKNLRLCLNDDSIWGVLFYYHFRRHTGQRLNEQLLHKICRPHKQEAIGWTVSVFQEDTKSWVKGKILDYRLNRVYENEYLVEYDDIENLPRKWEPEHRRLEHTNYPGYWRFEFLYSPDPAVTAKMERMMQQDQATPKDILEAFSAHHHQRQELAIATESLMERGDVVGDGPNSKVSSDDATLGRNFHNTAHAATGCDRGDVSSPTPLNTTAGTTAVPAPANVGSTAGSSSLLAQSWRAEFMVHLRGCPNQHTATLLLHTDEVLCVEFSHNGQCVACSSRDGSFTILRLSSAGKVLWWAQYPTIDRRGACFLCWSPNDDYLLVRTEMTVGQIGVEDSWVEVWDTRHLFHQLSESEPAVNMAAGDSVSRAHASYKAWIDIIAPEMREHSCEPIAVSAPILPPFSAASRSGQQEQKGHHQQEQKNRYKQQEQQVCCALRVFEASVTPNFCFNGWISDTLLLISTAAEFDVFGYNMSQTFQVLDVTCDSWWTEAGFALTFPLNVQQDPDTPGGQGTDASGYNAEDNNLFPQDNSCDDDAGGGSEFSGGKFGKQEQLGAQEHQQHQQHQPSEPLERWLRAKTRRQLQRLPIARGPVYLGGILTLPHIPCSMGPTSRAALHFPQGTPPPFSMMHVAPNHPLPPQHLVHTNNGAVSGGGGGGIALAADDWAQTEIILSPALPAPAVPTPSAESVAAVMQRLALLDASAQAASEAAAAATLSCDADAVSAVMAAAEARSAAEEAKASATAAAIAAASLAPTLSLNQPQTSTSAPDINATSQSPGPCQWENKVFVYLLGSHVPHFNILALLPLKYVLSFSNPFHENFEENGLALPDVNYRHFPHINLGGAGLSVEVSPPTALNQLIFVNVRPSLQDNAYSIEYDPFAEDDADRGELPDIAQEMELRVYSACTLECLRVFKGLYAFSLKLSPFFVSSSSVLIPAAVATTTGTFYTAATAKAGATSNTAAPCTSSSPNSSSGSSKIRATNLSLTHHAVSRDGASAASAAASSRATEFLRGMLLASGSESGEVAIWSWNHSEDGQPIKVSLRHNLLTHRRIAIIHQTAATNALAYV